MSAFGTDLVRDGCGVEYESRVSGIYCSIRVRTLNQYTSEGEYGMWWW